MKKLVIVLLISCLLLAACQPAAQTMASPGSFVSPGNLVTMSDALDPTDLVTRGNAVSPGNVVSPSNAEVIPAGVDASQYPVLTQELMDKVMEAFFAGSEVRYFSYDINVANGPNVWMDKPLIAASNDGKGAYESMDAKAYADGVVYDMWSYREMPAVGFSLSIYGRNLMSEEEVEALRPSDGIAWMSMQQGIISDEEAEGETIEAEAEKAITREAAIEKARALLTALGVEAGEPEAVQATYRYRATDISEDAQDKSLREYGWLITFLPRDYETIDIGVTASGYGQLYWAVQF